MQQAHTYIITHIYICDVRLFHFVGVKSWLLDPLAEKRQTSVVNESGTKESPTKTVSWKCLCDTRGPKGIIIVCLLHVLSCLIVQHLITYIGFVHHSVPLVALLPLSSDDDVNDVDV